MFEWTITAGGAAALVTTLATIGSVFYAIFKLGYKMRDLFSTFKHDIEIQIELRELRDQTRHIENLERFNTLEVRLARMGNGSNERKSLETDSYRKQQ